MKNNQPGPSTQSVHGGESKRKPHHAITNPIFQTATFVFQDTAELLQYVNGDRDREEYGRYGNPTLQVAEQKLAELEGAEEAALFSSGMCGITTVLLAMLSQGTHAIITNDCYRRTRQFCQQVLPRFGIETTLIKTADYTALAEAVCPNTRLILTESPTNPYLYVLDLEKLVDLARTHGIKLIIDSTFATPYNQKALEYGVDLVIHSATKYMAGHNDLLAGAVLGDSFLISAIKDIRGIFGGIIDPHCTYLLIRGLKTLALRMERHNTNGLRVARFLENHPRVRRVYYPGLESHPHHEVAKKQMKGYGGVVSFEIEGDLESTSRFIDRLAIPYISPSFGGVETLIEQPAIISYFDLSQEERLELGIRDELVRMAVGIEDTEDLIADLKQALDGI